MRKCCNGILIIPFLFLCLASSAQVNSVSPYSRLGLGEFQPENYTRAIGFGGANLALPDAFSINQTNPASYSNLELTTFDVGFTTNLIRQEQTNPDVSVENSNTGLRYFSFALPLLDWWGSAVGLQPYTARGYDIVNSRMGPDGIMVEDRYLGTGGLNKVYWGNAFQLADGLSLGVNTSFIFGNVEEQNSLNWGTNINNSVIEDRATIRGFRLDYGAQYSFKFNNNNELSLGATFATANTLNAEVESYKYITNQSGGSIDSLEGESTGEVSMPGEFGFGLSYGKKIENYMNKGWWATSKYAWAVSGDFEWYAGEDFVNYDGSSNFANSYRAGVGAFITPSLLSEEINRNGNYLGRIEYRLGGFYEETPYVVNLVDNPQQLTEYGITFGLGLPVRHSPGPGEVKRSVINTGVILGRRGSLEQGLIQESYLKIFIGISLNDKWFINYKYR